MKEKTVDTEHMKDLVQRALHQNLISEQAHKHVAPEMDVYLFAYSLSQQIAVSVML